MNILIYLLKSKIIFLSIIMCLIPISGCIQQGQTNPYIEGQLDIIFIESINETMAKEILEDYNIKVLTYPSDYFIAYRVEVPNGKENYYIELLEKNPNIKDASRVNNDPS